MLINFYYLFVKFSILTNRSEYIRSFCKTYYILYICYTRKMIQMQVPKWQMIKDLCIKQYHEFKEWQKQKRYGQFHQSHYDWWAFPIDRKSSYGDKYKLYPADRAFLKSDKQFLEALRGNSILVCEAWGYDLVKGEDILERGEDQCWQYWPIRLYKMVNSLEYFDQEDLFLNAIKYGLKLIDEDKDFTYGPKNLKPVFFKNEAFLKRRQRQKLEEKEKQPSDLKQQSQSKKQQQKSYELMENQIMQVHKPQKTIQEKKLQKIA